MSFRKQSLLIWSIVNPNWWIGIPLLIVTAIAGGLIFWQYKASRDVARQIAELQSQGIAFDNASLESRYLSERSTENSRAWQELAAALSSTWIATLCRDLPGMDNGNVTLFAQETVVEKPDELQMQRTAEALQLLTPYLEVLHQLADRSTTQKSMWFPVRFDGLNTTVNSHQSIRSIVQILHLDIQDAIARNDAGRVIRGLQSMQGTAQVYSDHSYFFTTLSQLLCIMQTHMAIARSIEQVDYSDEQLITLFEIAGSPQPIEEIWPQVVQGHLGLIFAMLSSEKTTWWGHQDKLLSWYLNIPSVKKQILDSMLATSRLAESGLNELIRQVPIVDSPNQRMLQNISFPLTTLSKTFGNAEELRRLVRLAIALKRHKKLHQSFPVSLDELVAAEESLIQPEEIRTLDRSSRVGYAVIDDQAILWNVREVIEVSRSTGASQLGAIQPQPPATWGRVDDQTFYRLSVK